VLGQVVNANIELEALAAESGGAALLPEGASAADVAAARLGRSLRLWLELQASVNGFIDSTTADKGVMVSAAEGSCQLHKQALCLVDCLSIGTARKGSEAGLPSTASLTAPPPIRAS